MLADLLGGADKEELRREDDPRRLDAIAEAMVRCETGDELLRQASHGLAANPDA